MSTATAGCWYPRYYVLFPQNSASGGSSMSNDKASEGNTLNLMEFLGEEVDGALIAQKICGESTDTPNYIPSAAALHVSSKQPRSGRKD